MDRGDARPSRPHGQGRPLSHAAVRHPSHPADDPDAVHHQRPRLLHHRPAARRLRHLPDRRAAVAWRSRRAAPRRRAAADLQSQRPAVAALPRVGRRHLPLGLRAELPGHRAGVVADRRAAGADHRHGVGDHPVHLDGVVRDRRLRRDPPVQAGRLRRLVHRLRRPRGAELPAGAGAALRRQGLLRPVDRRPDGSRVHRQADVVGQVRVGDAAPDHPGHRDRHVGHRRHDPPPARQPAGRAAEAVRHDRPRQGPAADAAADQVPAAPRHQPVRRRHRRPAARRHLGLGDRLGGAVAADHGPDAAGRAQDPGRQPRRDLPAVRGDPHRDRHADLGPRAGRARPPHPLRRDVGEVTP